MRCIRATGARKSPRLDPRALECDVLDRPVSGRETHRVIINSISIVDDRLVATNDFDGALSDRWTWIDVESESDDEGPPEWFARLGIDALAAHDAFNERDHPKFDDFGDHALLVVHGLRDNDRVET